MVLSRGSSTGMAANRADAFLRRAIPVHGLRPATYRESLRDDLPLGPRIETLSHGLPPAAPALDAGRCQRKARLAYPCGVGPAAHHPGEDAVRRRRTGVGPDQYRLRPGLDDHRSVPVGLSVGALPHHQGGGEDAHAARPAGQHSEFYPSRMASCTTFMGRPRRRKPEPCTSWYRGERRLCPPLCVAPSRGLLRTRAKSNIDAHRVYSAPTDRSTGIICVSDDLPGGFYTRQDYPELLRRSRAQSPARRLDFSLPAATICASGWRWNS